MVDRIGKDVWVVVSADGRSVVQDPALRQPFHHRNKKFADMVAQEVGGSAVTLEEAIRILTEKNRKPR